MGIEFAYKEEVQSVATFDIYIAKITMEYLCITNKKRLLL